MRGERGGPAAARGGAGPGSARPRRRGLGSRGFSWAASQAGSGCSASPTAGDAPLRGTRGSRGGWGRLRCWGPWAGGAEDAPGHGPRSQRAGCSLLAGLRWRWGASWGAMQLGRVSPGCTSARGFFILQRACLYWSLLVKLLCCGQPALGLRALCARHRVFSLPATPASKRVTAAAASLSLGKGGRLWGGHPSTCPVPGLGRCWWGRGRDAPAGSAGPAGQGLAPPAHSPASGRDPAGF